ncbi:hypothetical protein D3C87_488060 [compost metagenome]
MMSDLILFSFILLFLLLMTNTKIQFVKARTLAKKISATVIEYRLEKGPLRNDYTKLDYPYLKLDLPNTEDKEVKLHYANSLKKPFKIGEKIDVFWLENKLVYWNAYDNGFSKFLPKTWAFWRSEDNN